MEETRRLSDETILLKRGIEQLNAGDASVRGELLNIACARLMHLTSRMRHDFQGMADGGPGESRSTEDVFQNASARLYQALHDTPIKDVRHFYRLAAIQIRRELIELCRQCQQLDPEARAVRGAAANEAAKSPLSVEDLRQWADFHDCVDALPEDEREVFELIWYHELTRHEAADLLGVPLPEVRRLWRDARLSLHRRLGNDPPATKPA